MFPPPSRRSGHPHHNCYQKQSRISFPVVLTVDVASGIHLAAGIVAALLLFVADAIVFVTIGLGVVGILGTGILVIGYYAFNSDFEDVVP